MLTQSEDLFDLLGFVPEGERRLRAGAMTCLRDAVPDALDVVVHLSNWTLRDTRSPRASGEWAYCVSDAGVRFERRDEWSAPADGSRGGWDRTPVTLLSWRTLAEMIGEDPRRAEVVRWAESLTARDRWKDRYRPYELWPDPESWHPSYIESDRARPGYADRMRAWGLVQEMLTEQIDAQEVAAC